jgi:hypothetical protein
MKKAQAKARARFSGAAPTPLLTTLAGATGKLELPPAAATDGF